MWLILSILFSVAHAQTSAIDVIERANKAVQQTTGPKPPCYSCDQPELAGLPDWKKCLAQVCGGRENMNDVAANSQNLEAKLNEFLEKNPDLVRALKESSEREIRISAPQIALVDEALKANLTLTDRTAIHLARLSKFNFSKIEMTDGTLEIDWPATRKSGGRNMTAEEFEDLKIVMNRFLAVTKKNLPVMQESYDDLLLQFSREELSKQGLEALARIDQMAKEFEKSTGFPADSVMGDPAIRKQIRDHFSSGQFSSTDVSWISENARTFALINQLVGSAEWPEFRNRKLPPLQVRNLFAKEATEGAAHLRKQYDLYLGPNPSDATELTENVSQSLSKCAYLAMRSQENLPAIEKTKDFIRNHEPKMRQNFLQQVSKLLSAQTSKDTAQIFSGLKARGPQDPATYVANLIREINSTNRESSALPASPEARQRFISLAALAPSSLTKRDDYASSTLKICQENYRAKEEGHSMSVGDPRIYLGSGIIEQNQNSAFVANHEYAHALSRFVFKNGKASAKSTGWYRGAGECLRKGNPENGEGTKVLEEDWADLIGATTSGRGMGFACSGIDPDDEEEFTLKNKSVEGEDDDDHSTDLFRALHALKLLGEIPRSCTDALKAKGQEFKMPNCIEAANAAHSVK